ncbi:hypothetical protein EYF80_023054 [Liparis tanakae]|uniref:Secreted protein n=1 Tax=Liparis tanakae TaxID=230148 RepID=A0A4Z2HMZ9_9TELE|nr:hypothetical protein EYF80_023054 [Liparis tanakae]
MHLQLLPGLPSQLTAWLLTLSAAGMQRRAMVVGGPPSHLPVPLAARIGQLVLSAAPTDDLLSGKNVLPLSRCPVVPLSRCPVLRSLDSQDQTPESRLQKNTSR